MIISLVPPLLPCRSSSFFPDPVHAIRPSAGLPPLLQWSRSGPWHAGFLFQHVEIVFEVQNLDIRVARSGRGCRATHLPSYARMLMNRGRPDPRRHSQSRPQRRRVPVRLDLDPALAIHDQRIKRFGVSRTVFLPPAEADAAVPSASALQPPFHVPANDRIAIHGWRQCVSLLCNSPVQTFHQDRLLREPAPASCAGTSSSSPSTPPLFRCRSQDCNIRSGSPSAERNAMMRSVSTRCLPRRDLFHRQLGKVVIAQRAKDAVEIVEGMLVSIQEGLLGRVRVSTVRMRQARRHMLRMAKNCNLRRSARPASPPPRTSRPVPRLPTGSSAARILPGPSRPSSRRLRPPRTVARSASATGQLRMFRA